MVRRGIWWMAGLALATILVASDLRTPSAPPPTAPPEPGLSISLNGPDRAVLSGGPVPVNVVMWNGGARAVTILKPIDGCDIGWRPVSYLWEVTAPDREVRRLGQSRCGMVNPITEKDFLTLHLGESFQPSGWFGPPDRYFNMTEPGVYAVSLTYQFCAERQPLGEFLGPEQTGIGLRLRTVDELKVRSNPVDVTVIPLPPHLKRLQERVWAAAERIGDLRSKSAPEREVTAAVTARLDAEREFHAARADYVARTQPPSPTGPRP